METKHCKFILPLAASLLILAMSPQTLLAVMPPVCTISGSITASDTGEPLSGVTVMASSYTSDSISSSRVASATSDTDGKYTINLNQTGTFILYTSGTAQYTGGYYADSQIICSALQFNLTEGEHLTDINFALKPGASISGYIKDSNGISIEGLTVTAWDIRNRKNTLFTPYPREEATTDSSGHFTITKLPAGEYEFFITGDSARNYPTTDPGISCTLNTGQAYTLPDDIVIRPGGTISGTVRDTAGNPLSDIYVYLAPADIDLIYLTLSSILYEPTDAQGRYTISGIGENLFRLSVSTPDYLPVYYDGTSLQDEAQLLSVASGQNLSNIDFSLNTGTTISGSVVSNSYSTQVFLISEDGSTANGAAVLMGENNFSIQSPIGTFYLMAVPTFFWTDHPQTSAPTYFGDTTDFTAATPITVTKDGFSPSAITINLQTGHTISGVVVDSTGEPLAYAYLNIRDSYGKILISTFTACNGYYTTGALGNGTYTIEIAADTVGDHQATGATVTINGADLHGIDFVLGTGDSGDNPTGETSSDQDASGESTQSNTTVLLDDSSDGRCFISAAGF